ncbi:MAG: hypothetical protein JWR00_4273 [Rubritepida sp.]|nr:hypothetical protein [Rubritepida sp.]
MRNLPPWPIGFLKFGGVSGLGWIADTCILLLLIRLAGMPPLAANVISSCIAALSVFLLSREKVFNKAVGWAGLRVAFYLAYTLTVILIASAGLSAITAWLGELARAEGVALSATAPAAVAKVLVTPPQLVLNFLVSRFLIERDLKGGGSVDG